MLFKHVTDTAREAGLYLDRGNSSANFSATLAENAPVSEDPQLAMLRKECVELRSDLVNLQSEWAIELAKAKEQARREAAEQHLSNDRDRLAVIVVLIAAEK